MCSTQPSGLTYKKPPPRHTKDVIKMVPVVPLFSTQQLKGKTGSFSRIKIEQKN